MRNAMTLKCVPKTPGSFAGDQIVLAGPLGVLLAIAGCVWPWLRGAAGGDQALDRVRARLPGAIFLTTLAIIVLSRSAKSEYMTPAYALAFTLGGLACERAFARFPRTATAAVSTLFVAQGALAAPLTLAVLPEESFFVVLGGSPERLEGLFDRVERVSTFECGRYCMPYGDHLPIYLAHGLKGPLEGAWPDEKHYE